MRIISRKRIIDFSKDHPSAKSSLETWYQITKAASFTTSGLLRRVFPSADRVVLKNGRELTVFNIGGNKFRLIAAIHFNTQMVFIRHILTHADYSKEGWKKGN